MRKFLTAVMGLCALALATPAAAEEVAKATGPEIPVWEISFGPDGLAGPGATFCARKSRRRNLSHWVRITVSRMPLSWPGVWPPR